MSWRSIFLARWLRDRDLQRETESGLNVVDNYNGVNDYIRFGKRGELASNRREEQELGMLCLHILQSSLGLVNTLMIQDTLARPEWQDVPTDADRRGLTPVFHSNMTPYLYRLQTCYVAGPAVSDQSRIWRVLAALGTFRLVAIRSSGRWPDGPGPRVRRIRRVSYCAHQVVNARMTSGGRPMVARYERGFGGRGISTLQAFFAEGRLGRHGGRDDFCGILDGSRRWPACRTLPRAPLWRRQPAAGRTSSFGMPSAFRFFPHAHAGGAVSACLLCLYNIMPLLDSTLGTAGDPVGLCGNCNCLSCGWHGGRTATTAPTFLCIVCDDQQLFRSAGRAALSPGDWERILRRLRAGVRRGPASDEDAGVDLARALASSVSEAGAGRSPRAVATLRQWFAEHPHYQAIMADLMESVDRAAAELDAFFGVSPTSLVRRPVTLYEHDHDTIRSLWLQLGVEGRRLLAAAVLLAVVLKIPPDMLPPPVPHVSTVLATILHDRIPGEIEALSGKITRPQTHRG